MTPFKTKTLLQHPLTSNDSDLFPPFPRLTTPLSRPKGYRRPTWRALPEGDLLQQGFKSNKVPEDQIQIDVVGFASVWILPFDLACFIISCSNDLPGKTRSCFIANPSTIAKNVFAGFGLYCHRQWYGRLVAGCCIDKMRL